MSMAYRDIRRKWEQLHHDQQLIKELPMDIQDSWQRSIQYDIDYRMKTNPYICTEQELRELQENSAHLISLALPIMENLSRFVAGTGFVVMLADATPSALKVIGDQDALDWATKTQLVEGSMWQENLLGTNAGSLTVDLGKPVSVYGYEHFSLFAVSSAASCAPIIYHNKIIGIIAMVAPFARVSNHTLGMVVAASKHIESTLNLNKISEYNRVIMESMSEGVLVIDINGKITYINKNCADILGQEVTSLAGDNIYTLLANLEENQYFINSLNRNRTMTDESIVLSLGNRKIRCNITSTPLESPDSNDNGTVIILRENRRIGRLIGNNIGKAKISFVDIMGKNQEFQQVIRNSKAAARSDSNVLLLGESGTGKDVLAQAIHNASPRRDHPFVAINCAALPRELVASELFGYEEGAFTGARKGGNMGKFELADQGTIFLDEIGDMPLDLQASLLRVLEEKSVTRLGGSKITTINTRVIAATNKDIETALERNTFRRDLFYRLGVIRIKLPALRERKDDIPLLAKYFAESICRRINIPLKSLNPEVIAAFQEYAWPGNLRELQNILEGVIQLSVEDDISLKLVKDYLIGPPGAGDSPGKGFALEQEVLTLDELEKQLILRYLAETDNNKNETARKLGISRRTLYRRLDKYGLI